MVSALKVGGRRLHELARAGVEVDRPPRPVTVWRFDVVAGAVGGRDRAGLLHRRRVLLGHLRQEPGRRPRRAARRGCPSAQAATRGGGGVHCRGGGHARSPGSMPSKSDAVMSSAEALRDLPRAVGGRPSNGRRVRAGGRARGPPPGRGHRAGPWAVVDEDGQALGRLRGPGPGRAKPAVVLSPAQLELGYALGSWRSVQP